MVMMGKALVWLAVMSLPATALAAGDAGRGATVFGKCAACHNADKPENKIGPHLVNILGRKAGSVETFQYSDAMKKGGEDGLVWNEKNLADYLAAPKKFLPGNKMPFTGLKSPDDIADLLIYLKTTSK